MYCHSWLGQLTGRLSPQLLARWGGSDHPQRDLQHRCLCQQYRLRAQVAGEADGTVGSCSEGVTTSFTNMRIIVTVDWAN